VDRHHLSEAERTSSDAEVERIARSQGLDAGEVESLYESVLAEMKREAIIMDFLPIFAARKVKEMLLRKRGPTAT
jgi:hypothetical protein